MFWMGGGFPFFLADVCISWRVEFNLQLSRRSNSSYYEGQMDWSQKKDVFLK